MSADEAIRILTELAEFSDARARECKYASERAAAENRQGLAMLQAGVMDMHRDTAEAIRLGIRAIERAEGGK